MERLPILSPKLLASRPTSTLPTKIQIIKWNQPSLVATEYTRQISISNKATSRNKSLMLNPWYNLDSPMWENTKRRRPQSYLRVRCTPATTSTLTTTPTTHQPPTTPNLHHLPPPPTTIHHHPPSTTIHIIPHPRHLDNTCTYTIYGSTYQIRYIIYFILYHAILYYIILRNITLLHMLLHYNKYIIVFWHIVPYLLYHSIS